MAAIFVCLNLQIYGDRFQGLRPHIRTGTFEVMSFSAEALEITSFHRQQRRLQVGNSIFEKHLHHLPLKFGISIADIRQALWIEQLLDEGQLE